LWMSLRAIGRREFGAMVDRTLELAQWAYAAVARQPRLEPIHEPALGCLVFRYRPRDPLGDADALTTALRRRLFDTGRAVIGYTRVGGRSCLKFTFLNPCTSRTEVEGLVNLVAAQAADLEAEAPHQAPASDRLAPASL